jgi:hypothetical protein
MFSKNSKLAFVLMALFAILAIDAAAQWSPGGSMVYMGDFNLPGRTTSGGQAPYVIGGSMMNNMPMNNPSLNNSSLINASLNNSSVENSQPAAQPVATMDLSRYAKDRAGGNLAGYTNIMYPIAESGGFTASTAGGSGCGCG